MIATTPGGFLLVLALVLPVAAVLLAVMLGGRHVPRIAFATLPAGLAVALAIALRVAERGDALVYLSGGLAPPLGIALRADGLSALMLVVTAVVVCAAGLYARSEFAMPADGSEARAPFAFWTLLLAIWAALNAVFLGHDLFNLYVALELLTFAAVPLVAIGGRPENYAAAIRYLVFALLGSVLYLLGAALLYGAHGTLDVALLAARMRSEPVTWVAGALMTAGLLAKTALFPLHLWLPPAHAGAPAAASAVLSGLVVKGSYFLVVRLWFDVMPGIPGPVAAQILGALGAGAIVIGSAVALRQPRLKLMIAYSTVAQIGYLFLLFPLALATPDGNAAAWTGGWLQLSSHAFAKAAMFLAAGLVYESFGHDRIADLGGLARSRPVTFFAFAVAGLALMGIPPSGGFSAKWLLLGASLASGQWWWALVIAVGGLLAAGYVFRVIARSLVEPAPDAREAATPARVREWVALGLALGAVGLGLLPIAPWPLLQIGRAAGVTVP